MNAGEIPDFVTRLCYRNFTLTSMFTVPLTSTVRIRPPWRLNTFMGHLLGLLNLRTLTMRCIYVNNHFFGILEMLPNLRALCLHQCELKYDTEHLFPLRVIGIGDNSWRNSACLHDLLGTSLAPFVQLTVCSYEAAMYLVPSHATFIQHHLRSSRGPYR